MTSKKTGYPSIDRTHLKGISFNKLHPLILPLNLLATFLLINHRNLDEPAIISQGVSYTGGQLYDDTTKAIKAFLVSGLQSKDTVAIVAPNLYEGIVITLAANALGAKVVYLNNLDSDSQILTDLTLHNASFLVTYGCEKTFTDAACASIPSLRCIIDLASLPHSPVSLPYADFLRRGSAYHKSIRRVLMRNLLSKDSNIFLQTSGSTSGRPKSLPFSNENVFASLIYASNSTGTKTNDQTVKKVLCILPYRLPYGWMTIFVNLLGGNLVELAQGATPEDIANYWKTGASYIYGTPQIFQDFMDGTPDDADLSFLQAFFCSGFSISEVRYQEGIDWLRKHNCSGEIRNNYGIGEALCIGTASDGIPHRKDTSGKFYIGPKWIIVDNNLNEVKYGEIGEALLWSKSLCDGYFNNPNATAQTFIRYRGKRFYRSGDYVSLSEDGYVTFHGRKKRFYQPQGATDKVNCETIERALGNLTDYVKECAVVVYLIDGKSESSCAFVVLSDGVIPSDVSREFILYRLKAYLLDYQLPTKIIFLDDLPIMKSGKPDYTSLEKLATKL